MKKASLLVPEESAARSGDWNLKRISIPPLILDPVSIRRWPGRMPGHRRQRATAPWVFNLQQIEALQVEGSTLHVK
jgi:hypothetical protein